MGPPGGQGPALHQASLGEAGPVGTWKSSQREQPGAVRTQRPWQPGDGHPLGKGIPAGSPHRSAPTLATWRWAPLGKGGPSGESAGSPHGSAPTLATWRWAPLGKGGPSGESAGSPRGSVSRESTRVSTYPGDLEMGTPRERGSQRGVSGESTRVSQQGVHAGQHRASGDRKSTRLNSSHNVISRMPSSA